MGLSPLKIVMLGLSITSSWGNGHATTYRSLMRELSSRGHDVLFLERDVPWYGGPNRDMPDPPYGRTELYASFKDLMDRFSGEIMNADFVIVGSYVPDGCEVGMWVTRTAKGATAFYDIDTPVTMAKIERGDNEYITPGLISRFDLYLSFTGGPMLEMIEKRYRSTMARPLYCSVDPDIYYPSRFEKKWDLGYLGTYSPDRQPALEELMLKAAKKDCGGRFVVAGPMYDPGIKWPANVKRIEHLPPGLHRQFYNSMRYTLNITRADMVRAGYSPSVRLFEAAACGTAIISDRWNGIETIFAPGKEILISNSSRDTIEYLNGLPERQRAEIGKRARSRVLESHTASHRVDELEGYMNEVLKTEEVLP